MKRRNFLKLIGIGAGVAAVAPSLVNDKPIEGELGHLLQPGFISNGTTFDVEHLEGLAKTMEKYEIEPISLNGKKYYVWIPPQKGLTP